MVVPECKYALVAYAGIASTHTHDCRLACSLEGQQNQNGKKNLFFQIPKFIQILDLTKKANTFWIFLANHSALILGLA